MQRQITKAEFFKAIAQHDLDTISTYLARINVTDNAEVENFVYSTNDDTKNPLNPLIAATVSGNFAITKFIFNFIRATKAMREKRISFDLMVDNNLRGMLTHAAIAGNDDMVRLFAESGLINIAAVDHHQRTAAEYAAGAGHHAIANYLDTSLASIVSAREQGLNSWARRLRGRYGDARFPFASREDKARAPALADDVREPAFKRTTLAAKGKKL